jgi:pyrimidine-nucleoside phosphorylase
VEVTFSLGAEMLVLATLASTREAARAMMDGAIRSGKALEKFEAIIRAQDGDPGVVRDASRLPQAPHRSDFTASRTGVVRAVDPRAIGHGVIALGGGRRNMEDDVDPSVGFVITAKPQDHVTKGQRLATIHARSPKDIQIGRAVLEQAIMIGETGAPALPLVSHRITPGGVETLG